MRELAQFSEPELRKELSRRRKLRKEVKRKAHGEPKRRKGMGCGLDRDLVAMAARELKDPSSYIRRDGSEKLVGVDWLLRKQDVWLRAQGRCERMTILGKMHEPDCDDVAAEPHHIVKRSVRRDDRESNLAALSHACHKAEDPRKVRSGKDGA